MNTDIKDIASLLRAAGIRPSLARVAVTRYLLQKKSHPTVDELYQEVSRHNPGLSRTTIYNTVRALEKCGAITVIDSGATGVRVDWAIKPHAHFICDRCGSVTDIDVALPASPPHFAVRSTQLVFKGLCSHCAARSNEL